MIIMPPPLVVWHTATTMRMAAPIISPTRAATAAPTTIGRQRDQNSKIYVFPYLQDNVCCIERQQQDGENGNNNDNYGNTVTLELCTLPRHAGTLGPLGGEPWYGSALLASMLLLPPPPPPTTDDTSKNDNRGGGGGGPLQRIHGHLQDVSNQKGCGGMRVLELGSGAVAIPAFAAVLAIVRQRRCQRRPDEDQNGRHHETGTRDDSNRRNVVADHDGVDEVVLTDHDPQVLRQLRRNVQTASLKLAEVARQESLSAAPRMVIHHLDWTETTLCFDLCNIDLVIGSELVYTPETATSCFAIARELLRCNRDILIVLVEIADRPGWHDTFVPLLVESGGFDVECANVPVEIHQHAAAYRHVERGGTLNDLQDYEVCLISNKNNDGSTAHRQR